MKSKMDEVEGSPYCGSSDDIARERFEQKITANVGHDPHGMKS